MDGFDQKLEKPRHGLRRLSAYDYTQAGAYFVTLVTVDRALLFGTIVDGAMRLSSYGQLAQDVWAGLPQHYPHITLDSFVVMPNHIHGVVFIADNADVGTGLKPARAALTALPPRAAPCTARLVAICSWGALFSTMILTWWVAVSSLA
jgi:hypothetical protein